LFFFQVWSLSNGEIKETKVEPKDFGLPCHTLSEVKGGDPQTNLEILKGILSNEPSVYLDWVCMNTAALLVVNDLAPSFSEGVTKAKEALASGKAQKVLETFVEVTLALHQKKLKQ